MHIKQALEMAEAYFVLDNEHSIDRLEKTDLEEMCLALIDGYAQSIERFKEETKQNVALSMDNEALRKATKPPGQTVFWDEDDTFGVWIEADKVSPAKDGRYLVMLKSNRTDEGETWEGVTEYFNGKWIGIGHTTVLRWSHLPKIGG